MIIGSISEPLLGIFGTLRLFLYSISMW